MAKWAVWYMRYHSPGVETFDDERGAAEWADNMEEEGRCSVSGVQAPDGTLTERGDWVAYAEVQRKFPVVAEADGKRYKFPVAGVVGRIAPERKPKHGSLAVRSQ